jgi:ABC-2 type transport system ATP-binding protein
MSLVEAHALTKRYGDITALDGFNLEVAAGRIVGLIGPNGSGKTTALKTLLGLARPDGGELKVLGLDPGRDRKQLMRRVAYIADTGILPRWMKVAHVLDFVERVNPAFDRKVAEAALARTDVSASRRISGLSKGMHVQLHLALVLAIDAELLVLDEPTLGLDILYRQRFYDTLLNDYFEDGRSILVTTHEVREIEHILTDVVFIDHGRDVLSLAMDDLPRRVAKVVTDENGAPSLRMRSPLAERRTLGGIEFLFSDPDIDVLAGHGTVSAPALPELFVALAGDRT